MRACPAASAKEEETSLAAVEPRPTFPATVAGKETTFIEIGPDGEPIRSGSAEALADVAQVLVVVDPRALPNVTAFGHSELLTADVRAKTTAFLLLPSAKFGLILTEDGLLSN